MRVALSWEQGFVFLVLALPLILCNFWQGLHLYGLCLSLVR